MFRSSSCSSLSNYFALGVPVLGLLVILYIGALSLLWFDTLDLWSSFCFYYIIILVPNLSLVSCFLCLVAGSL